MKPYLVDVPVKINIWIRPECQKRQWEIVKQARPSVLFLQSDGGRNEKEWEAIYTNRKMIDESIDWECTVYRLYEDHNNGLYAMCKKTASLIWSKVDRCIFTEDDQLMSVSFFRYCSELLERYKDDMRIECICGMNHFGVWEKASSDYFFSKQGSIWGYATWKNREIERNIESYYSDQYILSLLKKKTKKDRFTWKRLIGYGQNLNYDGHVPGIEFWIDFNMYAQERVQIIPRVNLICNIGCTSDSEHSNEYRYLDHMTKRVFNAKLYELKFPLRHPKYVISDDSYMRKRDYLMGRNHPILTFIRKIESRAYKLFYGGVHEAIYLKRTKHED